NGAVLAGNGLEPSRYAFETRAVDALDTDRSEPVRTFPTEFRPEHSAGLIQSVMDRTLAGVPSGIHLLVRPVDLVVRAIGLDGALLKPPGLRLRLAEAPDIKLPEVHPRIAIDDPISHRLAGAAGSGDTGRKTAGNVEILQFGRETHDRLAVGRDGYGA